MTRQEDIQVENPPLEVCNIEKLLADNQPFALYRLPREQTCRLVRPDSGKVDVLLHIKELNAKKGFVFAPFMPSIETPLLLIATEQEQFYTLPPYESRQGAVLAMSCSDGHESYRESFKRFVSDLNHNHFRKLVLSRCCRQQVRGSFSLVNSFLEACYRYPRMMVYLYATPQAGIWLGCTPEILLEGSAGQWHTVALAGTMPVGCVSGLDEWSEKNREEQRLVSEYLCNQLQKLGIQPTEEGPYMAQAGPLVHLKSDFHFALTAEDTSIGEILELLHPTPAVCGLPKEEAWQYIPRHEHYHRGYYAGFVGMLNVERETSLYVNLRCVKAEDTELEFYAGGGILAQSDEQNEWEETEQKMNTVRSILRQKE